MNNQEARRGILIIGSINTDLVARVDRLPDSGETLVAETLETYVGGKGANQAVAAARLGAQVSLVGRLGKDPNGQHNLKQLIEDGIRCDAIALDPSCPTGTALILVENSGENRIILIPGANHRFEPARLESLHHLFVTSNLLLLQLEMTDPVLERAMELARQYHMPIMLDPAPARHLPGRRSHPIDYLTPNLVELAQLTQRAIHGNSPLETISQAALGLCHQGLAKKVITKMGPRGALMTTALKSIYLPAPEVQAVDTTAAGDCFNGVLAACLVAGMADEEAMDQAVRAASLSVTRKGAQASMPSLEELQPASDRVEAESGSTAD